MPSNYQEVTLESLNNGQLVALFDRELAKVLENIADDNTDAKATRSIVLTVKIKPDETREQVTVEVDGKAKLAGVKPSKSFALLSYDGKKVRAYQSDHRQALLEEIAVDEAKKNDGEVKTVDFSAGKAVAARG